MNFTNVYDFEPFSQNKKFDWIDCSHLQGTDCYCDQGGAERLKAAMAQYPADAIHFIDSGDFHYVTKFWTDCINFDFSLIVFDHHPDMQAPLFSNMISCGSWVKDMLDKNPHLKTVVIIGVSDRLVKEVSPGYEDRVHFYSEHALEHAETWKRFAQGHLNEPVYISIDKDVLSPENASTNWDQGSLHLSELKTLLDVIVRKEEIIGVDICGESAPLSDFFEEEKGAELDNEANQRILNYLLKNIK